MGGGIDQINFRLPYQGMSTQGGTNAKKIIIGFLLFSIITAGCGNAENKPQKEHAQTGSKLQENSTNVQSESEKPQIEKEDTTTEAETKRKQKHEDRIKSETGFPAHYKQQSESGKVTFDCVIELPDSFSKNNVRKLAVSDQCQGDEKRIMAKYVDGKEISEEHPSPGGDGIPDSIYYAMADGGGVSVGNGFSYSSGYSKYYSYAGVSNSENQDAYNSKKVSFATPEDAIAG